MKRKFYLFLMGLGLLGMIGWTTQAQKQTQPPKISWEYMSVDGYAEKNQPGFALNDLGAQGWELVSVMTHVPREGAGAQTVFYFKRSR